MKSVKVTNLISIIRLFSIWLMVFKVRRLTLSAVSLVMLNSFSVLAAPAKSSTYNFFFNNSEQGDHSTAEPKITVDGSPTDSELPAQDNSSEEASASSGASSNEAMNAPSNSGKTVATKVMSPPEPYWDPLPLRIMGGMASTRMTGTRHKDIFETNFSDKRPFWKQQVQMKKKSNTAAIEGTWFLVSQFGIGLFFGPVIGINTEIQPFAAHRSFFQPLLQIGIGRPRFDVDETLNDTKTMLYLGAGAEIRLADSLGLVALMRMAGISDDSTNFRQLFGGVVYRF